MRTKEMNDLVFYTTVENLIPLIRDMENEAREYVLMYYPYADIQIDADFNIEAWPKTDVFSLTILIHYFDSEITDDDGDRIFNTSMIEYKASAPMELWHVADIEEMYDKYWNLTLDFRFANSNLNDDVRFMPTKNMTGSFESKLMKHLYENIFWNGEYIC